jgi:hypothetical protein
VVADHVCAPALKFCSRKHRSSEPRWSNAVLIFCIDVERLKIVPVSLTDRFVALSYVWGQNILQTTVATKSEPEIDIDQLPLTIQDAIIAVRQLGETHLWVHSLCIDQKDEDQLAAQTKQMHLIYSLAIFTIVAVHGDSAAAGLPGVRSGTRASDITTISIIGKRLYASPHGNFTSMISEKTWRKRGWTYQEEQLSRRCLYFGEHEVLFRCRAGTAREKTKPLNLKHKHLNPYCSNFEGALPLDNWTSATEPWTFKHYVDIVSQYLQRRLTFEIDILRAFRISSTGCSRHRASLSLFRSMTF